RAVMAFGTAHLVDDPAEKERALVAMVDRFFPDRTASLRQSTAQEIKATSVISMEIEEASAKVRAKGVGDDEEDYALPIYAERIPVRMVLGAPEPCPRLLDGVERPATLNGYSEGRLLEDALRDAYFAEDRNGCNRVDWPPIMISMPDWSCRMNAETQQRILDAVDAGFEAQLATTRDFVAIPSTRGAEGAWQDIIGDLR